MLRKPCLLAVAGTVIFTNVAFAEISVGEVYDEMEEHVFRPCFRNLHMLTDGRNCAE